MEKILQGKSIKNVVFDFGGVICRADSRAARQEFIDLGLADIDRYLSMYRQEGLFGDVESGAVDAEGFRAGLSSLVGHEVSYEQCRHAWLRFIAGVSQRALETLDQLGQRGYRLALLSNTNPFVAKWMRSTDFDGRGHGIGHYIPSLYMSYEMRMMKPDEQIFRAMLASEGFDAAETLYLDDGTANIEAAAKVGMQTMLVGNGQDWSGELWRRLESD